MTIELTLQVFMLPDDLAELIVIDESVVINEDDCTLIEHTFYSIDALYPTAKNYCMIVSGGLEYQAKEKYEIVKNLIREQLTYRWN